MAEDIVSAERYEVEPIELLPDSVADKMGDEMPNTTSSTVDNGARLFSAEQAQISGRRSPLSRQQAMAPQTPSSPRSRSYSSVIADGRNPLTVR